VGKHNAKWWAEIRAQFNTHTSLSAACAAAQLDVSGFQRLCARHGKGDPRRWLAAAKPTDTHAVRERLELRATAADVRALQRRVVELEDAADFYTKLKGATVPAIALNRSRPKSGKRGATPVIMASDWHIGETVSAEETLGRNVYNLEVAAKRAANFWDNTLWLRDRWAEHETCDDTLIALNGDGVSGSIHPELAETNEVGLVEQCASYVELTAPGIIEHSKRVHRLIVTCVHGNHSRVTAKSQIKTGWANSLEALAFRWLRDRLAHLENVEWIIPRAEGCAVDVHEYRLQLQHGTQIKSQGGIGGILVPLTRWATRAASAHYYLFGHFHQAECYGKVVVNGSLIGDSAYSKWLGLEYREPEQVMFSVDARRGLRHFERVSVT
jgi:hypothetical protein